MRCEVHDEERSGQSLVRSDLNDLVEEHIAELRPAVRGGVVERVVHVDLRKTGGRVQTKTPFWILDAERKKNMTEKKAVPFCLTEDRFPTIDQTQQNAKSVMRKRQI